MKQCKYCKNIMVSEYESSRNNKSYTAFHHCYNCGAICDEKVFEYKGRKDVKESWYNPKTEEYEE